MPDHPVDRTRPGEAPAGLTAELSRSASRPVKSMHEDVPVWCDCCSCEAEPYWLEAMEEWERERRAAQRSAPAGSG